MTADSAPEELPGQLRVGVLGSGGVGGLLTGLLSRAGYDVTIIARPATCEILDHHGLAVHSSSFFGDLTTDRFRSVSKLADPVDVLFLAVKAMDLPTALTRVADTAVQSALVVPLLNGLEHPNVLRRNYPDVTLTAAAIRVEAAKAAPGVIEHNSPFANVELAPGNDPMRTQHCAALLRQAGLDTTLGSHEAEVLWKKITFLAPLALLTTCHDATAGTVRTDHRTDLLALTEEIAAVAAREHVSLSPENAVAFFDRVSPEMRSSMQKDAQAGRPLEIEAIGGAILRRAQQYDMAVPVTAYYVEQLRQYTPTTT